MKKTLSVLLCAAMLASMSVTAFAAENTVSSANTGTDENNPTSITVSGAYKESVGSDKKVSVDIAWEAMNFTYSEGSKGTWNDKTHSYDNPETGKWSDDTASITITNHSNVDVLVSFKFEGKNGIIGTFSKETLSIESADDEKYQTEVDGVYPAPSASTDFGIESTSPAITQSGSLGTITVTIEADEIDATAMDAATLTEAVTSALNSGKINLSIRLKTDADASMTQAIAKGLIAAGVEKSTVNLTLSGITDISTYAFLYESGEDASNGDGLKTLILPDVTTIGDYSLVMSGLISVSAPKATTIGDAAFSDCDSLTTVNLPNATTIGEYAFSGCDSLTTVSLPNATTIGEYTFYYCDSLTTVSLPNATTIGEYAFYYCDSLTTVSLPNATTIGEYAFSGCDSLTTVSLPNATTIGKFAFSDCDSLTTVNLPKTTTLGSSAFNSCSNLQSISLPSVTSVGYMAFRYCTSLSSVTFETAINEWGSEVFGITGEKNGLDTANMTLTLATGQKDFAKSSTNSCTITETDVTAGANAEFVGYTFKEIIIQ